MSSPHLTDTEVIEITEPLTQAAARCKFFERHGCKVLKKPNGQPLVSRADWEDRIKFLDEESIVARATPFDGCSGVYFLIAEGKIVYVGESGNVYKRLVDHCRSAKFDKWHYIPCTADERKLLEARYIDTFRPLLNRKGFR